MSNATNLTMAKHPFLPSLLDGIYAKASRPVSWDEVHRLITADASVKQLTGQFRSTGNEELKKALPALTTAVQLNGQGKAAEHIAGYTGVVHCDLDRVPDGRMGEALRRIREDPHTFLCNRSASGRGIHIYARYRMPFPATREEQERLYREAFLRMNCHYADRVGLPFDEQCGNPNKTLSLSHDAEAHYNPDAKPFRLQAPLQHRPASRWVKVERDPFEATEEFAARRGYTYAEGSRNDYLMRCLMHLNKLGVPQAEAERWALAHDGLPQREVLAIVRSCYRHVGEHGSFDPPTTWQREENLQTCTCTGAPHTHTRETGAEEPPKHRVQPDNPFLPQHHWPQRLQRMVDCGETQAQKDVILLSALVVFGALLSRVLRIPYGHKSFWPNLQCFVIAPPASGKGCISWVRKLAEPVHKDMMAQWQRRVADYRREKAAYEVAGAKRADMETPVEPKMTLFLVAGNNSSTGIQENLMDAEGRGLICEVEADTMSEAINADYGGWSDLVRKAFEHERLAYNRRANHEYREIDILRLSVLLSGTPAQVRPLIPSAENGLYSRQIFYTMPDVEEWIDQFTEADRDYDRLFTRWGEEWKETLDRLESSISSITFRLSAEQQQTFNGTFAQLFAHAIGTHEDHHAKSSVIRMAINILRIMSVVALLRALEEGQDTLLPAGDIPKENIQDGIVPRYDLRIRDDDFEAVLRLAEPLYRHAMAVLLLLPSKEAERRVQTPVQELMERLPMSFTRAEVLAKAEEIGLGTNTVDSHLRRLVNQGRLLKKASGVYEFPAPFRVCV